MNSTLNRDFLNNVNILVTGGAGFIGCALSNKLADNVGKFLVLDCLHPQVHKNRSRPKDLHEKAELVEGDITDSAVWDSLLKRFKPDIVFHLAAETGTGQSLTEANRHGLTNVVGTTCMTDALTRHRIKVEQMVLTSSRAIYGEGAWTSPTGITTYPGQRTRAQLDKKQWDFPNIVSVASSSDNTHPDPTSIYGATKLAQEHILKAWALAFQIPLTILRLQNVYGRGQSLTNSYTGIVALFSRIAKEGKSIPLYEDGQCTRDFVNIDDVANSLVAAIQSKPKACEIFDIGTGNAITIEKMAKMIAHFYHSPIPIVNGKFRDGDVRHASCDLSSTLIRLNWKPQHSLQNGLIDLQDWISSELAQA